MPILFVILTVGACVPRERQDAPGDSVGAAPSGRQISAKKHQLPAQQKRPKKTQLPAKPSAQPANQVPTPVTRRQPKETAPDPLLSAPFHDDFERRALGSNWRTTSGGPWRIKNGRLCGRGAKNHPVWLTRRLPANARVEFDAVALTDQGDIKAELWGDGRSAATGVSYTDATSYLTIFGGWKNSYHVLARIDEHAKTRKEIRLDQAGELVSQRPVEKDYTYRFKVERADRKTGAWLVDDIEVLRYEDSAPLLGAGHEHFGFNNWQVEVCFDNLVITPLL